MYNFTFGRFFVSDLQQAAIGLSRVSDEFTSFSSFFDFSSWSSLSEPTRFFITISIALFMSISSSLVFLEVLERLFFFKVLFSVTDAEARIF